MRPRRDATRRRARKCRDNPERRQLRYTLRELVAKITRRNLPEQPDFGPSVEREVW